jgi:hypothetical protein
MSFFKVDVAAAAKSEGGRNTINTAGSYEVTLKNIIVDVNDKGARTLNLFVDNNGTAQVMYGAIRLDNNDGTPNFQAGLFNKLAVVCGIEDISNPEEEELPIGKAGAMKEVAILPDFKDIDLKMRVQMEYSIVPAGYAKAGQISEKKVIKAFYTDTGASAEEILNETEAGVKLAKDSAYAGNVTYKDGLTEEVITAWIAGGRDSGSAPASTAKVAPKVSFGKPSFGKK